MSPKLARLIRTGAPSAAAIDAFLAANDFPLAHPDGVTFVYRGEAEAVSLRHWVFGLPAAQPLTRLAGTDLWQVTLELPAGSRIEYKLEVVEQGEGHWITDPLNPHLAHDPFGANSIGQAHGYQRPDWTLPDPDARPGSLEPMTLASQVYGDQRRLQIYRPARFRRSRRYPLLIVHDGTDFCDYGALQTVLDNLIHRQEVAPMIVALSDPVDRMAEYRDDPRQAAFLAEELLVRLGTELPLIEAPSARALMGASLGAVASLATAWRYPGVFANLLLQSGSFAFSDIGPHRRDPLFDPVAEFVNAYRASPDRPAERLYLSCGMYESLIYENRSMLPVFQQQGFEVRYEETRDGHHWENWRDRLRNALSWLFPGPLWMVYE